MFSPIADRAFSHIPTILVVCENRLLSNIMCNESYGKYLVNALEDIEIKFL